MIRKQTKKPQLSVMLITHCIYRSVFSCMVVLHKKNLKKVNFLTGTCYYDFQLLSFILGLH